MSEPQAASELFRAAYENRYTWDENFPGYSADIQVQQGDEVYTGKIGINHDLTVEVSGIPDEEVKKGILNQLNDVITHRKRTLPEQAHGKNRFTTGADGTGAVEILVDGGVWNMPMGSNYKVRDRTICYVYQVMGEMTFVIDTHECLDTGAGYLPTRYDAVFRNSQTGDAIQSVEFDDTYSQIGDYYLIVSESSHPCRSARRRTTGWASLDTIDTSADPHRSPR
ncbi:MAG: DUF3386 domain-containing protein [Hormoscilla sp. SP5CHS1]|nr:DUF3386 domain-containing protein [Hormoscilla sp. SP5CHS1]